MSAFQSWLRTLANSTENVLPGQTLALLRRWTESGSLTRLRFGN
jgi:hypothetical protein